MRIRILLMAICLMASTIMSSQTIDHVKAPYPNEANIGAIDVERDGQSLVIFYTLRFGKKIHWCDIALYQSTDGGKSFTNISSSKNLSGDIGRINEGGDKKIYYNISSVKEQLADKQLVFKVEIQKKDVLERDFIVLGTASVYPVPSYGGMVATVKKMGFYLKYRNSFKRPDKYQTCLSDGTSSYLGGSIMTTGEEIRQRVTYTGGIMYRVNSNLYPYIGVGSGFKYLWWEYYAPSGKSWAQVEDLSYDGLTLDAGILFKMGHFAISASVSNTAFKYTEGEIGIGYVF